MDKPAAHPGYEADIQALSPVGMRGDMLRPGRFSTPTDKGMSQVQIGFYDRKITLFV